MRTAIERELTRDGQVFFVHNRILDIHKVAARLRQIVPEATIGIAHGRLGEHDLEEVMLSFVRGQIDILLATTIVESGLDVDEMSPVELGVPGSRNGVGDAERVTRQPADGPPAGTLPRATAPASDAGDRR